MSSHSPQAALAGFHQSMLDFSADDLADLHAVDAIYEFPFLNPTRPPRYVGREAIRAGFREAWGAVAHRRPVQRIYDVVIHETLDPEVIVAEQCFDATSIATGAETFSSRFLLVLRVRDGLILHTRDYADVLRTAQGMGRLAMLMASLSEPPGA